jgi:hypothetical protein
MKVIHQPTPEQFLKDVEGHKLTVIRNDGLYRHIRFAKPGTRCMSFELVTWPGYLAYTGDMGSYVFTRLDDMFEFFRCGASGQPWHRIDRRYWAEKCEAVDRGGIKEFCEETFNRVILERLVTWIRDRRDRTTKEERRELWDAVISEVIHADGDSGGYRKQCAAHDFSHRVNSDLLFYFQDLGESSVERYTYRFVWCCYALAWGIGQFDKLGEQKAVAA